MALALAFEHDLVSIVPSILVKVEQNVKYVKSKALSSLERLLYLVH